MDGFVLGGGMGLVQGADLRVVTERSRLAMPEVAIGYFPDVGGSYYRFDNKPRLLYYDFIRQEKIRL